MGLSFEKGRGCEEPDDEFRRGQGGSYVLLQAQAPDLHDSDVAQNPSDLSCASGGIERERQGIRGKRSRRLLLSKTRR
jgi:hypothetical protein